ncbi:probable RNA-directed DNA polymerase from transposon BS isoform X1 [Eurosta solidaginis]|uniref:probable RNA-directed DNA polymerase from transposon BS isoform X1 n=1 Tax=Eurosta solidaginis TaxID=178769 RepID=UPI003530B90E
MFVSARRLTTISPKLKELRIHLCQTGEASKDCWKTSVIVPVEKVKGTIKPEEIRPINTLPSDEKIIETVVKNQLLDYLNKNEVIIKEQSGFRSKHSCETALNLVIAEWKESRTKKQFTISVFLDLKRAFETVDRDILIRKLYKIGIRNIALNWFKSYLSGRKQKTVIRNKISPEVDIEIGLPQGSVLAAILFIIYINDIKNCIKYCKIRLFADDALLTVSGNTIDEAASKIQSDLQAIYKWLCQNMLKINIEKTKWMIMGSRVTQDDVSLKIANTPIERVTRIKYLGIIIDDKLKFDEHLKYIEGKISKKIGFMFRSCRHISMQYKIMVYRSIIEPHFIYCPTILFALADSQKSRLQIKQNKVMRFILRKRYDTPIKDLLDSLNWLSVKQNITYYTLKFIHNIKLGNLPNYLSESVRLNREVHSYQTRHNNNFYFQ